MRIVAAMSGGVDSSVAALLLKKQGHEVIGITIKTWPKAECGAEGEKLCCSLESIQFARSVAEEIGIPYYVVDLSAEFTKEVRDYFASEYAKGRTPNPCVYCNSRIKFGHLMRKAKELGAEKIATGHYARILEENGKSFLFEASDKRLDQSYFLCDIPRATLEEIEFPLGEMNKEDVRKLAAENNLMTAWREASQDICFAYLDGGYREYLVKAGIGTFTPGDIVDVNGKVIGTHKGIASYTIGQRRGIGLGMPEPVYVIGINPGNNTITVGKREHAMKSKIRVERFNWYVFDRLEGPMEFDTVIRYNGDRSRAVVTPCGDNAAMVEFKEPQFAPTPGQAAVFYDGEKVAGGAWIEEVL